MTKYRIMVSDRGEYAVQRKVLGLFWAYELNWVETKLVFTDAEAAQLYINNLKQIRYKPKWRPYHYD